MEQTNQFEITDENFKPDVLDSEIPVLVDFWAEWCQPCHMIAPTLKELADEYTGKVRVGKLNVDENPITSAKFGIRGIPSLLLFKDGKVVEQATGVRPKSELKTMIDGVISSDEKSCQCSH